MDKKSIEEALRKSREEFASRRDEFEVDHFILSLQSGESAEPLFALEANRRTFLQLAALHGWAEQLEILLKGAGPLGPARDFPEDRMFEPMEKLLWPAAYHHNADILRTILNHADQHSDLPAIVFGLYKQQAGKDKDGNDKVETEAVQAAINMAESRPANDSGKKDEALAILRKIAAVRPSLTYTEPARAAFLAPKPA